MKLFKTLLLFAFALCALNCNKDSSTIGPVTSIPANVWPLKIGNAWRYNVTEYDTAGHIISSHIDSTTWKVTCDTLIAGEKWYWLAGAWVANRIHGFCVRFDTTAVLYFRYPATPGDNWSFDNTQCTLLATNANAPVPGGTFPCYHYRLHDGPSYSDWYIQAGGGLVLYDNSSALESGMYRILRYELVSRIVN